MLGLEPWLNEISEQKLKPLKSIKCCETISNSFSECGKATSIALCCIVFRKLGKLVFGASREPTRGVVTQTKHVENLKLHFLLHVLLHAFRGSETSLASIAASTLYTSENT